VGSLKKGRERDALKQYLGVLEQTRGDADIHLKVAQLFVKLDQPEEAQLRAVVLGR
jgi:hypothetical protein